MSLEGDAPPERLTPQGSRGGEEREWLADLITEALVRFGPRLFSVAIAICGRQFADDAVNSAAAKAWERPEAFVHGDVRKLANWLEVTVRRDAVRQSQAAVRAWPTDPELLAAAIGSDEGDDPAVIAVRHEERLAALEALGGLPPDTRRALVLNARGYPRRDMAELLGATEATAKRRLLEGRRALGHFAEELRSGARCASHEEALSDLADGVPASGRSRSLERHLAHCGGCRAQLVRLRRERARVAGTLPPVLLLPALAASAGEEAQAHAGRQLAEVGHDGILRLASGLWVRVVDGWQEMGTLARLMGAGMLAVLALAGIGQVAGHRGDTAPPTRSFAADAQASPPSGARPTVTVAAQASVRRPARTRSPAPAVKQGSGGGDAALLLASIPAAVRDSLESSSSPAPRRRASRGTSTSVAVSSPAPASSPAPTAMPEPAPAYDPPDPPSSPAPAGSAQARDLAAAEFGPSGP